MQLQISQKDLQRALDLLDVAVDQLEDAIFLDRHARGASELTTPLEVAHSQARDAFKLLSIGAC